VIIAVTTKSSTNVNAFRLNHNGTALVVFPYPRYNMDKPSLCSVIFLTAMWLKMIYTLNLIFVASIIESKKKKHWINYIQRGVGL